MSLLESAIDKRIDRMAGCCAIPRVRYGRTGDALKGPVPAGISLRYFTRGRNGTLVDPRLENCNFLGLERLTLCFGGHPPQAVRPRDGIDQAALAALTRLDRRAPVAAALHGLGRIESQSRPLTKRPMAGVTPAAQDGLDLPQIVHLLRRGDRG